MKIFNFITEICLIIIVIAMIIMTYMGIEITEPMKTISLMIVSAFFGSKTPGTFNN